MEASIRGILENLIDEFTSGKSLANLFTNIKEYKPIVKSEQDAVFGYIHGLAVSNFAASYQRKHKRVPNISECTKFNELFKERAIIIMTKIEKFSNR